LPFPPANLRCRAARPGASAARRGDPSASRPTTPKRFLSRQFYRDADSGEDTDILDDAHPDRDTGHIAHADIGSTAHAGDDSDRIPHPDAGGLADTNIDGIPHADGDGIPHPDDDGIPHPDDDGIADADVDDIPHADGIPHPDVSRIGYADADGYPVPNEHSVADRVRQQYAVAVIDAGGHADGAFDRDALRRKPDVGRDHHTRGHGDVRA
jgi:hypothetical protein